MSQNAYCIDIVWKLLASVFPVIMYFVPKIFIYEYYNKFLCDTFVNLKTTSKDPGAEIGELDYSVIKIISFVSFLSILICSVLSLLATTSFRTIQISQPICRVVSIVLLISSIIIIAINLIYKFEVRKIVDWFELVIIILITMLLFYSNVLYGLGIHWFW